MKPKQPTVTTSELASMIQRDVVAHMATKDDVAGVEQRLDRIEMRLDRLDEMRGLEKELRNVTARVSALEGRRSR